MDVTMFWSKISVSHPDDCWLWLLGKNAGGYGSLRLDGRTQVASRVAWQITNGEIPSGLCVLHKCDNRLCCNPRHLFLGTKLQNTQDMCRKGRAGSHISKLNAAQVAEILSANIAS